MPAFVIFALGGFIAQLVDGSLGMAYGVTSTVAALLIGGVIAAPLAAYLVRIVPMRLIGVGAGGLIVLTNAQTLTKAAHLPSPFPAVVYALIVAAWIAAVGYTIRVVVNERREFDNLNSKTPEPA